MGTRWFSCDQIRTYIMGKVTRIWYLKFKTECVAVWEPYQLNV